MDELRAKLREATDGQSAAGAERDAAARRAETAEQAAAALTAQLEESQRQLQQQAEAAKAAMAEAARAMADASARPPPPSLAGGQTADAGVDPRTRDPSPQMPRSPPPASDDDGGGAAAAAMAVEELSAEVQGLRKRVGDEAAQAPPPAGYHPSGWSPRSLRSARRRRRVRCSSRR